MNELITQQDHYYMSRALELAHRAEQSNEIPVGAVVVLNDEVIGEGWNQPISTHNPAAHAEVLALQAAAQHLHNYRTINTTLYVTLEPCAMCAGLMVHARVGRLVFGASDLKTGAAGSAIEVINHDSMNHKIDLVGGVMAAECGTLLSDFFKRRRAEIKANKQAAKLTGR